MAYVPLDEQLKTRGKAAADMIGTKLGKSSSALIQSMLFVLIPSATYATISPFLMCIFMIVCIVWIWAVIELNKEYKSVCLGLGS
jgi:AAA family ATP:ADP antiporter